jgi:hypothetical protein
MKDEIVVAKFGVLARTVHNVGGFIVKVFVSALSLSVMSLFVLSSCLHLMAPSEVEEVTTCKDTDLKAIRKNLLLNGFKVTGETAEDLQTDYKQMSGYSGDKESASVTVVKIDDKTFKFRVRVKEDRLETRDGNSMGLSTGKDKGMYFQQRETVATSNESDQVYYVEHRARHEALRAQVCGR